jgi:hypothetical protein
MTATMISLADRDRLLAGQHLVLAATGHGDESVCGAQAGGRLCHEPATHRIRRLDYTTSTTRPPGFTPGVVRSRVCAEHAAIVQDEPDLLDITEIRGAR